MLRALSAAVLSGLLVTASPSLAASPFDGTWKADTTLSKLSTRPDSWTVKGGVYDCTSCTPPYKIAADGKPHPVANRDYWDAAAVKVIDANTLSTTRYRKGVAVDTGTRTVSADGSMLTWTYESADNAEGKLLKNTSMSKRVGPAPAGAHATSGSWEAVNEGTQFADESLTATIAMSDDVVTLSFPTGEHYSAKLDGPQVPLVGDKANSMVALTRQGEGFVQTDYVNGKATGSETFIPVDATTVTLKSADFKSGTVDEFTLKRQ